MAKAQAKLGSIGNPQKRSRQEEADQSPQQVQQAHPQHVQQDHLEEEFQQFISRNQLRKQRKVNYGCSEVSIEEEGGAAPVEFYIGNTSPRATKEIIESVLVKVLKVWMLAHYSVLWRFSIWLHTLKIQGPNSGRL